MLRALLLLVVLASTSTLGAEVVTFDDLPDPPGANTLPIPNSHGGIVWTGNWWYYTFEQDPYNPASSPARAYLESGGGFFSFAAPAVTFGGAYFAGQSTSTIRFDLYNNGVLVATSDTITLSNLPTFLASGYSGPVDAVEVLGSPGAFVMDDVTYTINAVPEPASWLLFGSAVMAVALRRRVK
jgi:hypothetical protein